MTGFFGIGLTRPKFSHNIGSALRACDAYQGSFIAVTGSRTKIKGQATDTTGARKRIPIFRTDNLLDVVPYDCVPVAVEFLPERAVNLTSYIHPSRAFYIFGPEDGTLGMTVLDKCRDVVYLPTNICLNLATTVATVLYDRKAKQQ